MFLLEKLNSCFQAEASFKKTKHHNFWESRVLTAAGVVQNFLRNNNNKSQIKLWNPYCSSFREPVQTSFPWIGRKAWCGYVELQVPYQSASQLP